MDDKPVSGPPRPPLGRTRKARIDNLHEWFIEMTVMDNVPPFDAAHKVIDAAVPADPTEIQKGSKVLLWLLLALFVVIALPALFWSIGNLLVPAYEWSLRWAR